MFEWMEMEKIFSISPVVFKSDNTYLAGQG